MTVSNGQHAKHVAQLVTFKNSNPLAPARKWGSKKKSTSTTRDFSVLIYKSLYHLVMTNSSPWKDPPCY